MLNTNNNLQTQTSNALHNAIMEAGGKDHPLMLEPKGSLETTTEGYMENYKNISQVIRNQLDVEAEAIQIILTRIDNDIYSTVDTCPNAYLTLIATKMAKNEVNEIRAERLARTAHPLALVAQQQPVYDPQNHPTNYTQNSSTKPQQAAIRNRGNVKNRNRDDTDDEPEDQDLEAHYLYMAQIQDVTPDAADNSRPIFDDEPLQKVQNDDDNYNVFANDREHPQQPEYVNDTYPDEHIV
ncbi:hypothetical protein Tco_0730169 [Tanacetum coccineum]|uniref:Uncharacterized protein n=1 Tax=Tanacetum coccineum TaxID=301880 RepID=A0ABQ4YUH6_9ASTR